MKLLVSTKKTQGKRKNDFCWVDDGEIVTFAFECDREEIDGTCGCRRALTGVKSRKATTTFEVAELKITKADLIEVLAASYMEAGFAKDIPAAKKAVKEDADELISLANSFPVGTVLEKRGNELQVRVMGKKEVPMKTPAKTQTQPRTKPPEQTKEEFVAYLRETLIPDLKEAGSVETAADFERCLSFMGDKEQVLVPKELLHHALGFALTHEGEQSDPPETWLSTKLKSVMGVSEKGTTKKSFFKPEERMKLGPGYTEDDKKKIQSIATRLVAGQVEAGKLNPEDDEALKKAVMQASRDAKAAYDAAVDFLFR